MDAPEPGARAVGEHRFDVQVAAPDHGRRADELVQEALGGGIALEDVLLAAFLVVEDEADGDAGAAGPGGMRRLGAVADEVAAHGFQLSPKTPSAASSRTCSEV